MKTTTCKKCGRIIIGTKKFGVCDRCYNKIEKKVCISMSITVTGSGSYVAIKKNWPKIQKAAANVISNIK